MIEIPKILIVDDKVENLIALEKTLSDLDAKLIRANSGNEALGLILDHEFALILLDVQMPEMDGFETAELIRSNADTSHIPIVFVTAISKEQTHVFDGYAAGAVDYLFKPLDPFILKSKVSAFLEFYRHKAMITQNNKQLVAANRQILEQQKSVIAEERLNVLLQMAGSTAHELNQPLMSLLGNIELLKLLDDNPEELNRRLESIEVAGRRISDIVKKMQTIRRDDVKSNPGSVSVLNLDKQVNVLIVEDGDPDFEMFRSLVKNQNQLELIRAKSISEGFHSIRKKSVDLIFLDYLLPDGNGLEFLKRMEMEGIEKPVVAVTGHGDEIVASQMIKAGAYDYLPKANISLDSILRSIATSMEKFRLNKEVERATQKMAEMVTRDQLTGLSNRRRMNEVLGQEFSRAVRYKSDLSCILLDLDYFKEVNDQFGHAFGDFVLHQFGERLSENVRETDYCFRYGGEEFMVLLPHTNISGAQDMAEKLRKICEKTPYQQGEISKIVTVSIGVTSIHDRNVDRAEELLGYADKALYQAKADGRNRVKIYQEVNLSENGDPLTKKINLQYFKNRMMAVLEKTKKASLEALELLVRDTGDSVFSSHNRQVRQYLELVGPQAGLSKKTVETLKRSAALHDCTKILLSQAIMSKKIELSKDEMDGIKDHPLMLAELVEPFDFFSEERATLLYHHERFDGSGYPYGLEGEQIPIGARFLAIADAVVAMNSERPHRQRLSEEQVLNELVENAGSQFDPNLIGYFLDVFQESNLLDVSSEAVASAKETLQIKMQPGQ
jgi:two-component system cell cycle response regulator